MGSFKVPKVTTPRSPMLFGLVVASLAVALALAGGASANHMAITVSTGNSAQLVNGVYLVVPVSISCPDPSGAPPFTFVYSEEVHVSVTQKTSGRTLVSGGGGFSYVDNTIYGYGPPWGTPLTCDGAPHTYIVNVFPASSAPFHGGPAVVQATASIDLRDPSNPYYGNDYQFADSGLQSISIRG